MITLFRSIRTTTPVRYSCSSAHLAKHRLRVDLAAQRPICRAQPESPERLLVRLLSEEPSAEERSAS